MFGVVRMGGMDVQGGGFDWMIWMIWMMLGRDRAESGWGWCVVWRTEAIFNAAPSSSTGQGDPWDGEPRQDANASLMTNSTINGSEQATRNRNRNNSVHTTIASSFGSTPGSPASSRPRTPGPQASSEVTPWDFQHVKVSIAVLFWPCGNNHAAPLTNLEMEQCLQLHRCVVSDDTLECFPSVPAVSKGSFLF